MAYDVQIAPSAKNALETCFRVYGQSEEIRTWLRSLAEFASRNIEAGSLDLGSVLGDVIESAPETAKKESWQRSWQFLRSAGFIDKVRTVYHIISKRNPPVQLRAAKDDFFFLGAFTQSVTVIYEVNHVEARIVFRNFQSLPGQ